MNKTNFIAQDKEDISLAAIDFFSFGHLLIGYLFFLIFNAIFLFIFEDYQYILSMICVIVCASFWELIENTLFYRKNIKFGYRRDSILNSLADIIFFMSGGLLALINFSLGIIKFLINTTIIFIGTVYLMKIYAEKILKKKIDYFLKHERIVIQPPRETEPVENENRVEGTLRDIIFKGQHSDYFVILENGAELVVSAATDIPSLKIRHAVEVSWLPDAGDAFLTEADGK